MLMKLSNNYNLKASSLAETVIAMALISISLAIAFAVYNSVVSGSGGLSKYEAEQQLKEVIYKTRLNKDIGNEDFDYESYKIIKTTEATESEGVFICDYKVEGKGIKINRSIILRVNEN